MVELTQDAGNVASFAKQLLADIVALEVRNTAAIRIVRRDYSRRLKPATPAFMYALADELLPHEEMRWVVYELLRYHPATFAGIGAGELEKYGQGMNSWNSVDEFARTLAGPAWLRGQVPDALIAKWACSADLWWRRAALVSTVALNTRSRGGMGDVPRTLAICRLLVNDGEDMVVKAMSWALRELIPHDQDAVRAFLAEHDAVLAARVKREVNNKLATGLKNP